MHANGRHFYRPIHALAAAVALIASIGGMQSVYASDTYTIRAGGNLDWSPDSGALNQTSAAELDATGALIGELRFGFFGSEGTADYTVTAGAGVARAKLSGHFDVPSGDAYAFNPGIQAYSYTELTISGPAGNIATSVNVHVDGFLGIPVCGPPKDPDLCGALNVEIHAANHGFGSEFNSYGTGRVNDLGLVADPVPGGYHVHGDVALPLSIPANVPYGIELSLTLGGGFNGGPGVSTFAGDFDVAFARGGPVLNNIPAGYTVSGRGVVNNAWTDPFAPTSDDVVVTDCADPALTALTSVAGSLVVTNIAECADISFANLKSVGGDLIIEGNNSLKHVAIPGPVIVDGSVRIVNNDAATNIDLGIGDVGGDLSIEGNDSAASVNVLALNAGNGQIGGSIDIVDNGTAVVNINDITTVFGSLDISTSGDSFSGNTAGGVTDVTMLATTATMEVVLPQGALDQSVAFTITRHTDPAETRHGRRRHSGDDLPDVRLSVHLRRAGAEHICAALIHCRHVPTRRGGAGRPAECARVGYGDDRRQGRRSGRGVPSVRRLRASLRRQPTTSASRSRTSPRMAPRRRATRRSFASTASSATSPPTPLRSSRRSVTPRRRR